VIKACCLLCACAFLASRSQAQDGPPVRVGELRVTSQTVLRVEPGNSASFVRLVAPGTTLRWLEGQRKHGYYRVLVPRGPQGWIPVSDAEVILKPPRLKGSTVVLREACEDSLEACSPNGCATPGSDHALFNQTKRRVPPDGDPRLLSFADFAALQEQATSLVDQGQELSASDRASLKNLTVSSGTVREGDLVQITGFIAIDRNLRPSGGESVNCSLSGAENNDVHVPVVEQPGDTEWASVVVEPIPQNRPLAWNIDNFKEVQSTQRRVLVLGALFYDNMHLVNSKPDYPIDLQPKRFSLWEIHPVTAILICTKRDNSCDPGAKAEWIPIGTSYRHKRSANANRPGNPNK